MSAQQERKELKEEETIEKIKCPDCQKSFPNEALLITHVKIKHTSSAEPEKPKPQVVAPTKATGKSKGGLELYQQELEDRIYAFLGELGQKNTISSDDADNNAEDSDKMIGQANYIENVVVRTPYESEFDARKTLGQISVPQNLIPTQLWYAFKEDTLTMWDKLVQEKEKWEFCDPIELYKMENEEFTLVNVPSVARNYKKKGIEATYPELTIFVLWLTKTCKPLAWKQLYTLIAYVNSEYIEYRKKNGCDKDKAAWKNFNAEFLTKIQKQPSSNLTSQLVILKQDSLLNFCKMYNKWVTYFGLE